MKTRKLDVLAALSLALSCLIWGAQTQAQTPTPLIAQACAGCHGQAGAGQGSVPRIAGYSRDLFVSQWAAFRANERPGTIMGRVARGYTDAEVAELAAYFASLK